MSQFVVNVVISCNVKKCNVVHKTVNPERKEGERKLQECSLLKQQKYLFILKGFELSKMPFIVYYNALLRHVHKASGLIYAMISCCSMYSLVVMTL